MTRVTGKQAYYVWGKTGFDYGFRKMEKEEAELLVEAGATVLWCPDKNDQMKRVMELPGDQREMPEKSVLPEWY